jgi:hypothetical protein
MKNNTVSRMLAVAGAALVGTVLTSCTNQTTTYNANDWYDEGYEIGIADGSSKMWVLTGEQTPAEYCADFRLQVTLGGESDSSADDFFDGCIDGLRDYVKSQGPF